MFCQGLQVRRGWTYLVAYSPAQEPQAAAYGVRHNQRESPGSWGGQQGEPVFIIWASSCIIVRATARISIQRHSDLVHIVLHKTVYMFRLLSIITTGHNNLKQRTWREDFLEYHGLSGKWPWFIPDECTIPGDNSVKTPVTTPYFSLWHQIKG